ncbi:MAG: HAD family hydrolase [Armatimonadota bacterium]
MKNLCYTDIRWLFFDLGNTLVDETGPAQDRICQLQQVLQGYGLNYGISEIEEALYQASEEQAVRLITRAVELLCDGTDIDACEISRQIIYRKELERVYPNAISILQHLSARYNIGVIANQSPGTAQRLETFGLAPFVSLCLASAEEGVGKPDVEIFRRALARADCLPSQAVMVGDRIENDIRPAKQLGMYTIHVLQGFAQVQQPGCEEDTANITIGSIDDLLPVLGITAEGIISS